MLLKPICEITNHPAMRFPLLGKLSWAWDFGQSAAKIIKIEPKIAKQVALYVSTSKEEDGQRVSKLEKSVKVLTWGSIAALTVAGYSYLFIIPAVLAVAQTIFYFCNTFENKLKFLKRCLKEWVADRKALGEKRKAKRKIIDAYLSQKSFLSLQGLGLTQLPPFLSLLTHLKELDFSNNQISLLPNDIKELKNIIALDLSQNCLTSLPAAFGKLLSLEAVDLSHNEINYLPLQLMKLHHLEALDLSDNCLKAVPVEIEQLSLLRALDLSHNYLTCLPKEIGQLSHLKALNIADNQLFRLPLEIGQLTNLTHFYFYGNWNLQELPLSLSALTKLSYLDCDGTQVDLAQARALEDGWQAARERDGLTAFKERLQLWIASSGLQTELQKELVFHGFEKRLLNEWLFRLEKTRDYSRCQSKLSKIALQMMQTLQNCPEFKETFFSQVRLNNECCQDRAAMSFNLLYTAWRLKVEPQRSIKQQLDFMRRAARTLALRQFIANCIAQQEKEQQKIEKEGVEIYLYYETLYKKKLRLLTAIKNMAYDPIGKREWIKEKELLEFVAKNEISILIELDAFEQLTQKDSELQQKLLEVEKKFQQKLPAPLKEASDPFSEEQLNWQIKNQQILQKLKEKKSQLLKSWLIRL